MGDEHQYQTSKYFFNENVLSKIETDIVLDDISITASGQHLIDVITDDLVETTSPYHGLQYSGAVYHRNATNDLKMNYETLTTFRAPFISIGMIRTKRWIPPKDMYIYKTLHRHYFDFSMAEFVHKTCTIHIKSVIGRVYIIIPPGVNITFDNISMIGHIHMKDTSNDTYSTTLKASCMMPTIHITGLTVVDGVHVKVNTKALPVLVIH